MKNIKIIAFLLCLLFTKGYYSSTYVVTTTADATSILYPVVGSLRWAIEQANSNPGADVITFNISGSLPLTITLNYDLPIITGAVSIDGNTQPGSYLTGKKIIINAMNCNYGIHVFNCSNHTISNLEIKNYKSYGLYLDYVGTSTISDNIIYSTYARFTAVLKLTYGANNVIKSNLFGTDYSLSTNPIYYNLGAYIGTAVGPSSGDCNDNIFGGATSTDGNKFYNVQADFYYFITPNTYHPVGLTIVNGLRNKSSNNQFINCGGGAFNYFTLCGYSNSQSCKAIPTGITATPSGPNFIIQGNTAAGDVVEIYKSNPYGDIMQLLGSTTANGVGVFSTSITGVTSTDRIAVSGTFTNNTTSEFAFAYLNSNSPCCSSMSLSPTGIVNYTYLPGYHVGDICKSTTVALSATNCAGGLTYNWLFDDTYPSSSATGQSINKFFAPQATYPTTLNVSCLATGSGCNPSLMNIKATVYDCSCNSASIGVGGNGNCFNMGEFIPFSVVGCTDPGLTYNWSFGDGYFGTGLYPYHSYITANSYNVGVTITGTALPTPIILSYSVLITQNACPYACNCSVSALGLTNPKTDYCVGEPISFDFIGTQCNSSSSLNAIINMGDCTPTVVSASGFLDGNVHNMIYSYSAAGTYNISIIEENGCTQGSISVTVVDCVNEEGDASNPKCQPPFAPTPGDYVLSFWIREDNIDVLSYISGIEIFIYTNNTFYGSTTAYANGSFNAANKIIDGWQKVEKIITIPNGVTSIDIKLRNLNSTSVFPLKNAYFDDIRFHPVNSGFKSYVYDPVSLRLVAELDDRNYATFYEYDEEGQLIRVKKETDRGIKTIKENRTSVKKK